MVFIYKDGRDLVGYEAVLPNIPGAIRYLASITEKYGLNIVYIEECTVSEGDDLFFIVVDFTNKDIDPEMLLKEFQKNKKYVTKVEISPSFKNIIFPKYFCVKTLGGLRVILMGLANMKGLLGGLKKQLGGEAASSFIYHLGYGVGKELYDIYSKFTKIEGPEEGIKLLEALTKGAGWCELISYSIKEDMIVLKVGRLWECEIFEGKADKPTSNYVRGMLVSFFEKVLNKQGRLVAIERNCIGKGEPFCVFEIKIM